MPICHEAPCPPLLALTTFILAAWLCRGQNMMPLIQARDHFLRIPAVIASQRTNSLQIRSSLLRNEEPRSPPSSNAEAVVSQRLDGTRSCGQEKPAKLLKQALSHAASPRLSSNPYPAQAGLMDFILPLYSLTRPVLVSRYRFRTGITARLTGISLSIFLVVTFLVLISCPHPYPGSYPLTGPPQLTRSFFHAHYFSKP
jgi:hypothetical protein